MRRLLGTLTILGALAVPLVVPGTSVAAPHHGLHQGDRADRADRADRGHAGGLPSEATWKADVRTAMRGSQRYLLDQSKEHGDSGQGLAINLDVDNTMLATAYDPGTPVLPVRAFTRRAHRLGIAVLVNTARPVAKRAATLRQLRHAGYHVDEICLRPPHTRVVPSKQGCRAHYVGEGYTLIANVGNRPTDLRGGDYQRGFKLPDYGGRLS